MIPLCFGDLWSILLHLWQRCALNATSFGICGPYCYPFWQRGILIAISKGLLVTFVRIRFASLTVVLVAGPLAASVSYGLFGSLLRVLLPFGGGGDTSNE